MENDQALQAIWLTVSDLERSSAFYREVVGLRPASALAGAAQFDLGNSVRLWLWPAQGGPDTGTAGAAAGSGSTALREGAAPATHWPGGGALVLAVPEGIEARCQELEARGVVFETPLVGLPLGRMARFPDPDGHLLCLWEPAPGTPALARPPLTEAQARASEELLTLLSRAQDAKALGDYAGAATLYQMLLEAEPTHSAAWGSLGYVLNQQGRYAESLTASARALVLDPTLAEVWNNQGNALHALGRHTEALAAFERGIKLAPATPEFLINKALTLSSLGRQEEALATLDRALALKHDLAVAWSNRGWVLALLGRYAEALESAERALELGLRVAGALDTTGYALAGLGRYAEALGYYERALAEAPNDLEILEHHADALDALARGPSAGAKGERVDGK